jgi:hypothetical protein
VVVFEFVAAGGSFLIAVLWFDLMFDVQTRGHDGPELPVDVRVSIAAYYRRVTTQATPMNRLVSLVMVATLAAIVAQIAAAPARWVGWASLLLAAGAIGLAAARTVRNAVRLGRESDPPRVQSELARGVYRDHIVCLVAMTLLVALQLTSA